jgi:transcriptional regulator with XRE-family HTH domain
MATKTARAKGREVSLECGKLFKARRIAQNLSLEEVAGYLMDVSSRTLEQYENGESEIPLFHIYALANYLNVHPALIMQLIRSSS